MLPFVTVKQLCDMETHMLAILGFGLSAVTPFNYLEFYVSCAVPNLRPDMHAYTAAFDFLCKYVAELGCVTAVHLDYAPSLYAMAAVVLGLHILHSQAWVRTNIDI